MDWSGASRFDQYADVVPDTNSTVDLVGFEFGGAERVFNVSDTLFTFLFQLWPRPSRGPRRRRWRSSSNMSESDTYGVEQGPSRDFRSDYVVGVTGSNGALGKETIMRMQRVLFLVGAAAALGLGGDVATAQDPFVVDGDWRDWPGVGGPGLYYDAFEDVTPDTNSTVDVIGYSFEGWDPLHPPKPGYFLLLFEFWAPPFQGSVPTTVDLFFDVSPDTTFGDPTPPWRLFRPDYRLTVTGQDGRLTSEAHRRYTGGRWQAPTEGADIPELEVALSGQWLEGAIAWSALGGDPPRPEDEFMPQVRTYSWAVQVSQGPYRDYVPDDLPRDDPIMIYLTTVEAQSWGRVKSDSD